jgi:hypothetical protein
VQEEREIVFEADRIVAPDDRRSWHHLIQDGEVRWTVTAGPVAFRHGQRKTRIWRIAEQRRIEPQDPRRPLADIAIRTGARGVLWM